MVAAAASGIAQSPEAPTRFDVVSIKPSAVTNGNFAYRPLPGGGLSCMAVTLKMLIMESYGVKAFQVSGGPGWVGSARWDLEARAEGVQKRLPRDRENAMVRALLEDRFQLKVQSETKEMPVFALVVAKGGSKLRPHTGDPVPSTARHGIGSFSVEQGGAGLLANELQRQLFRVVIDKTDLKDAYDYTLTWAPEPGQGGDESLGLPPQDRPPLPASDGPSIFTALQEQLGLRLESQKGPVEIVVIDGVEKPSEN
jgi:bla regulator protein blaR1